MKLNKFITATAPEPSTFIRERAQLEQEWCVLKGMQQQYKNLPSWHDAPTEPGLWAPPSGVVLNVTQTDLEHWEHVTTQCAWYGPIPENKL